MEHWQPYLVSLIVGLLIGIERERTSPHQKIMGVRTFVFIALLGALAGSVNHWIAAILALFTLSLIVISYASQMSQKGFKDRGLTTEFAAAIVFMLCYISHTHLLHTALLGPLVAAILFSKKRIHRFTHIIKDSEFESAILLLLTGVVIVSLVPDRALDPWGIFNPKNFGYIVLTLAAIEFASYLAIKIVGQERGVLLLGFLGGLVSSTAVTLSNARAAQKNASNSKTLVVSTVAAQVAAMIEALVIILLVFPKLLQVVALPVVTGIILGVLSALFIHKRNGHSPPVLEMRSPLDWRGVLRLALMLAVILALISMTKMLLSNEAGYLMSFVAGLFELHGVVLANSTLIAQQKLDMTAASLSVILAVCASMVSKLGLSWLIARGSYAKWLSAVVFVMALAMVTVLFVFFK